MYFVIGPTAGWKGFDIPEGVFWFFMALDQVKIPSTSSCWLAPLRQSSTKPPKYPFVRPKCAFLAKYSFGTPDLVHASDGMVWVMWVNGLSISVIFLDLSSATGITTPTSFT